MWVMDPKIFRFGSVLIYQTPTLSNYSDLAPSQTTATQYGTATGGLHLVLAAAVPVQATTAVYGTVTIRYRTVPVLPS